MRTVGGERGVWNTKTVCLVDYFMSSLTRWLSSVRISFSIASLTAFSELSVCVEEWLEQGLWYTPPHREDDL